MCRRGFSDIQTVLKHVSDDRLSATIIWLPVLRIDDRASAEARSSEFADPRLTYFWDGNRITGSLWQQILQLDDVAWDVYFLYGPTARWEKDPGVPTFWMHQLGGVSSAARLNEAEFEAKVKELLSQRN